MNSNQFGQNVGACLVHDKKNTHFLGSEDEFRPHGVFTIEHHRDGKLLDTYVIPNGVTNVGKNHALDVVFANDTQTATWYIGIIDNSGYTAVDSGDTMSSHAGWSEFHAGYSEATRVEWAEDAAASQAISNTTTADFSITATATLRGVFVTSVSTKGGTTGILWATALFSSTIDVVNTDSLKITYTVTAS